MEITIMNNPRPFFSEKRKTNPNNTPAMPKINPK